MSRVPIATYRLQLHGKKSDDAPEEEAFGFDKAAAIADYLHNLGVSHVYSSPYLQAAPHSQHGYDVVDHHKVNDELGGPAAHERFCQRLGECHLGQVLDIVPNHMAISGRRNRYWWDILQNGPSSRYERFFDIDWDAREEKLRNKLLVPILGDHYGRVLKRGEVKIQRNGSEFVVKYFDHELPAAPKSLPPVLNAAADRLRVMNCLPEAKRGFADYLSFLADSLSNLPNPTETDPASIDRRERDKQVIFGLLEQLFKEECVGEAVDAAVEAFNQDRDKLDSVLEQQNYRLAYWHTAEEDLGYRRFFDVNTLVGLRMEDPRVFAATHTLILKWLHEGVLDGIRIDHPDGLRNPSQYFERLRHEAQDVWIVAEKILEPGEQLPSGWPIDGTTGYDYLNQAGGLFVDPSKADDFTNIYTDFIRPDYGEELSDYPTVCRDKKHRILRDLLGSDVSRLVSLFMNICETRRDRRDYTRHDVTRALREVVACFPVYRTYVIPARKDRPRQITDQDKAYIHQAIDASKKNRPEIDEELFDFIAEVLLTETTGELESEFVMRFQQFTSPVMAKGVEDTAFYCYNRLLSLNEVGGDPGRFGICLGQYHQACAARQQHHPQSMLASSTHDTKRSEDVRARISLLSEIPDQWNAALNSWHEMNARYRKNGFPDRNTEYLLYQTMIGAWPIGTDRLLPYIQKACREAKLQTSWLAPNEQFEAATRDFIEALYKDEQFQQQFAAFLRAEKLVEYGWVNSLALTLLKLTSPGIPDMYQGAELWDLSLVDPDNRRPVDYPLRRKLLGELPGLAVSDLWTDVSGIQDGASDAVRTRMELGVPKLWTIYHSLRIRRERAAAFGPDGNYEPLPAEGEKKDHLVAYLRGGEIVALVPRLVLTLQSDWGATSVAIPPGKWKDALSGDVCDGGKLRVGELLRQFPLALLVKQ